jgi:FkbM family methyltransferase
MSVFQLLTDMIPVSTMAERRSQRRLARRLWWHTYQMVRPSGLFRVPVGVHRMLLDTRDSILSYALLKHGIYEPNETDVVSGILQPGDSFVDCGANVGYYTLLAAGLVGARGKVFAFEPDPDNFRLLQQNIAANKLEAFAHAMPIALGMAEASITLHLDAKNHGAHSVVPGNVAEPLGRSLAVRQAPLDALSAAWPRVRLIKIDAQGAEPDIVAGASKLLARDKPAILVEWWPWGLRHRPDGSRGLAESLADHGYKAALVNGDKRAIVQPIGWDELLARSAADDPDFAPTILCRHGSAA